MTWPSAPLSDVIHIIGGGTPSKANSSFWSGDIPWVSPKDMISRDVKDSQDHISNEAVTQSATQLVPAGSVLIVVRSGILARHLPIGIARRPVTLNQDMKALIPTMEGLDSEFVAYFLESRSANLLANCVKRGATVHSLDMSKLKQIKIPVPSNTEQRRIVELLDQADSLRKKRAIANEHIARILPALFIKMFGDPTTNPNGWNVCKLGSLTQEFRYGTSVKCDSDVSGLPVLRIPNVVRGELDLTDLKYAELPAGEVRTLKLEHGDILIVRTNGNPDYVGRCSVFDKEGVMLFASYLIRARLNLKKVNPWYVTSYLQLPSGRRAMSPAIRTTAGQSNINIDGLKQINIPLPPHELQLEFFDRLSEMRVIISKAGSSEAKLSTLFDSLLHRAFSGDLTASWREAHIKELLAEMEVQNRKLETKESQEALWF